VAVLLLFEEPIETVNDPILSAPSITPINHPFSNEMHFKVNDFPLSVVIFLISNPFVPFIFEIGLL
jgi:hypothetical protein